MYDDTTNDVAENDDAADVDHVLMPQTGPRHQKRRLR